MCSASVHETIVVFGNRNKLDELINEQLQETSLKANTRQLLYYKILVIVQQQNIHPHLKAKTRYKLRFLMTAQLPWLIKPENTIM